MATRKKTSRKKPAKKAADSSATDKTLPEAVASDVEATPPAQAEAPVDDMFVDDMPVDDMPVGDAPVDDVVTAATLEPVSDLGQVDADPVKGDAPESEAYNEPAHDFDAPPPADPVAAAPAKENGVLLPMIIGGLLAGGIGYGVSYYMQNPASGDMDALEEQLAMQSEEIAALQSLVAEGADGIDTTVITDEITALRTASTTQLEALTSQVDTLAERLDTLEKQPSADGTLSDAAIAAFQRELDEIRSENAQMAADAASALQVAQEQTAALEQTAENAARAEAARAAIATIEDALESGDSFADALPALVEAIEEPVPDALTAAADGAATLAQLQGDFPAAARATLADARRAGAGGEDAGEGGGGGLTGFLKSQLNVRSVAPQEGNSVDAILSRAEAALRSGDLAATMGELDALPDTARGTLSEWTTQAQIRLTAQEAVDTLSQSINNN